MFDVARGTYAVSRVVGTEHAIGDAEGDSGTILCTGASNELAVGICIGQLGAMSLFEPVGRAIGTLRRGLGKPNLSIWG